MSQYAYWRRKLTPKGNLGKLEFVHGLDLEELTYRLKRDAEDSAWLHVEVEDVYFKGSSSFVGSGKQRRKVTPKAGE